MVRRWDHDDTDPDADPRDTPPRDKKQEQQNTRANFTPAYSYIRTASESELVKLLLATPPKSLLFVIPQNCPPLLL
jgi:hypothetical protein